MDIKKESKYFKLDGKTSGFALWIYNNEDFIRYGDKIRLFRSLELAKVYIANELKIYNPYNYKVWIILENGVEIDFDDVQEYDGYYQYYLETEKYFISSNIKDEVVRLGYFVFEDGDTVKSDLEYGKKRGRELFGYIRKALYNIVKYPSELAAIDSIYYDNNGHLCASIKNSTAKIHICYNNKIMTLNQARKESGMRCLPYEKGMDKYITIYTYITRDISETRKFKTDEWAIEIKDKIVEYIQENYPESEPRYIGVKFNGLITMEE